MAVESLGRDGIEQLVAESVSRFDRKVENAISDLDLDGLTPFDPELEFLVSVVFIVDRRGGCDLILREEDRSVRRLSFFIHLGIKLLSLKQYVQRKDELFFTSFP